MVDAGSSDTVNRFCDELAMVSVVTVGDSNV